MKKLALLAIAIFATISMFANVDKVGKPENDLIARLDSKLNPLLIERLKKAITKVKIFDMTVIALSSTVVSQSSEQIPCGDGENYREEVTTLLRNQVIQFDTDDDFNILLVTLLADWLSLEQQVFGECPELHTII